MASLKLSGVVATGDPYRSSYDEDNGAIFIGDVDLIEAIDRTTWDGPVTVAWADRELHGPMDWAFGWGYSEYTPMDADELTVGPHDLIALLEEYAGKEITLWIADEHINVLEGETHA